MRIVAPFVLSEDREKGLVLPLLLFFPCSARGPGCGKYRGTEQYERVPLDNTELPNSNNENCDIAIAMSSSCADPVLGSSI